MENVFHNMLTNYGKSREKFSGTFQDLSDRYGSPGEK